MLPVKVDLTPELERFRNAVANASTYHGGRVSPSIMKNVTVEIRKDGGGILAPYWFAVLQQGRGPRRNPTDYGLWKKIYRWMEKRSMFRARTPQGKISEAKGLTWYINKYGNEQFRSKAYVDVYESSRNRCIEEVRLKYGALEHVITNQIL